MTSYMHEHERNENSEKGKTDERREWTGLVEPQHCMPEKGVFINHISPIRICERHESGFTL